MTYDKPPELYDGLRLHQNENTLGCSPRVIEALATLRPEEIAFYPPYAAATRACALYLGVEPDRLALTNGLDEGRPSAGRSPKQSCQSRHSRSFASIRKRSAARSCR